MGFQRFNTAGREVDLNKVFILSLFVLGNLYFTFLFLRGSYSGYIAYRLQTTGHVVIGTVVGQKAIKDIKPHIIRYLPIIQYQVNGQTYTRISGFPSGVPEHETGESIELLYDPANPAIARINNWEDLWFNSSFILIFIPIASVLGNIMLLGAWLQHKEKLRLYNERHLRQGRKNHV